jgi:crotonobetaine/carnitine-CoA ligase
MNPQVLPPILVKGRPAPWHDAPALLRDKALQHGDKIFCVIDGRGLSYVELDRLCDRVGANLAAAGVCEGDCVASMMFNCAEQLCGWIGANRIGAIWAPFNASLAGDDFAYTLRDSGARVLIVDGENAPKIATLPNDLLTGLRVYVVAAGGVVPGHGAAGTEPFDRLLAEPPAPLPAVRLGPDMPAMVLYSGGTTGMPKGVLLPHFAFICVGFRYGEVLGVSTLDHHYTTLPMFHASGIQLGILGPLLNDMTTTMDRRFSASGFWQRVRACGATVIDPIGTMMTALVQQPASAADRNHRVRISTGVNGQIPPEVPAEFSRRFGVRIVDIYGNTECGAAMATSNIAQVPGSVGHPNGWSEIAIVDEHDNRLAAGEIGKIVLRPTIPFSFMLGYHNNPAKTVETWRNLWVHTGDLGRLDEAGNLFFVGREAHWIRRRGENISAHEIETILSQHPGVRECIVIGVPSELGEEDVKAWIIPADKRPLEEELARWCISRMAPFKVPRYLEFTDSFPRSATKQEVERAKLKRLGNEHAWDRERHLGRLSGQGTEGQSH